jgi:hypothetical protein
VLTKKEIDKLRRFKRLDQKVLAMGLDVAGMVGEHSDSIEDLKQIIRLSPGSYATYRARIILKGMGVDL